VQQTCAIVKLCNSYTAQRSLKACPFVDNATTDGSPVPRVKRMTWNKTELAESLLRYDEWLATRNLSPNTVHSHNYYAGLFVRWLYGEYAPRGRLPRPDPVSPTRSLSATDLAAELQAYRNYLTDNGLIPGAVQTYVQSAGLFLKRLGGGSDGPQTSERRAEPARMLSDRPITPSASVSDSRASDGWPGEGPVQSAVVAWLVSQGWSIVRVAQTSSREHGVDIVARRGGSELEVEVKGYPAETYSTGDRAGQPRKYHPASQARTYFGDALLAVLSMRDRSPASEIALALPDVPGYGGLVEKVRESLVALRIRVLFVGRDGTVRDSDSA
jgi:hypothetical protein